MSNLVWHVDDLQYGIPVEYQGAELPASLRQILGNEQQTVAMVGAPGTGKTRNLWAMLYHARKARFKSLIGEPRTEPMVHGITSRDRVRIITEAGNIRAYRYDRAWLTDQCDWPHWLAIDDIGCIEPNEWVREAVYHLANERRAHNRRTIWTSNLDPDGLRSAFGGAIASRILGGVVVEVEGRDRRMG